MSETRSMDNQYLERNTDDLDFTDDSTPNNEADGGEERAYVHVNDTDNAANKELDSDNCTEYEKTVNDMGTLKLESEKEEEETKVNGQSNSVPNKGERILIERDGKFELVDAAAVKAEYFDMLGLNQVEENDVKEVTVQEEKPSNCQGTNEKTEEKAITERPHTSPVRNVNTGPKQKTGTTANRTQSASVRARQNSEYGGMKSKYGMTAQQLEMKKKREEALLRRRKEEEQRRKEETERKRQDAEKAFQAWLQAKNSEAIEKKKASARNQKKDDSKEKEESAERAYQAWLDEKAKQLKQEKLLERCRLDEEASSFVIRDRNLCEAAFQSWLRKKRAETNKKTKRHRKKKSHGKDSQSSKPSAKRLSDYYGHRGTVST